MKSALSFVLLFVAICLFVAAMLGGGWLLIAVGLIALVVSERVFRRGNRT